MGTKERKDKPIIIAQYHDGVVVEYTFDTAIDRLSGYYKDMSIVKGELLAGRSLPTIAALYYAKDWQERK